MTCCSLSSVLFYIIISNHISVSDSVLSNDVYSNYPPFHRLRLVGRYTYTILSQRKHCAGQCRCSSTSACGHSTFLRFSYTMHGKSIFQRSWLLPETHIRTQCRAATKSAQQCWFRFRLLGLMRLRWRNYYCQEGRRWGRRNDEALRKNSNKLGTFLKQL